MHEWSLIGPLFEAPERKALERRTSEAGGLSSLSDVQSALAAFDQRFRELDSSPANTELCSCVSVCECV